MKTDVDIATMAAVLATSEGLWLSDEPACILCLNGAGYRALEILTCIDQARAMAIIIRGDIADAMACVEREHS